MSRSLLARIEALEKTRGGREPLYIIFNCFCPGDQITGYSWNGGRAMRKAGESDAALLERAEREALPYLEPWGGIALQPLTSEGKSL